MQDLTRPFDDRLGGPCRAPPPPQPVASPTSTGPWTELGRLRPLLVPSGPCAATPHPKQGGAKEKGDQGPRRRDREATLPRSIEFNRTGRLQSPASGAARRVVYPKAAPDASAFAAPGTAWPIAGAEARRLPVGSPARFPISTLSGLRFHGDPGRGGSQAACPVASFRGTTFSR